MTVDEVNTALLRLLGVTIPSEVALVPCSPRVSKEEEVTTVKDAKCERAKAPLRGKSKS